jgi:hypothetical protein
MTDDLTDQIINGIREVVAKFAPAGATAVEIFIALQAAGAMVSRETVSRWLRTMHDAHQIELRAGRWVTGSAQLLAWDKPPLAQPYEEWASYQADSAPPGTYQPNMSPAWMDRWKAKMCGQRSGDFAEHLRVEIRRNIGGGVHGYIGGGVQVKVVAYLSGEVTMSMNGTAEMTAQEFAELPLAVAEAREVMQRYVREHPAKLPA